MEGTGDVDEGEDTCVASPESRPPSRPPPRHAATTWHVPVTPQPACRRPPHPNARHRIFEEHGAKVVVDESSLALLDGATIDFEDDMLRSAFVVAANPMSESGCGCGTSFNVKV